MNKQRRFVTLSILSLSAIFALASCGNSASSSTATSQAGTSATDAKTVSSLAMKSNPTKVNYYVGDTFDPTGAVVTITYSDSTSEDVPLTDSRLEVSSPAMDSAGKKNIIVKYGTKRVTFAITVTVQQFTVTFNYNYEGATNSTVKVDKGTAVAKPTDPTRTGYAFDAWYSDTALTSAYDFASLVSADFTLYAKWTDTSKATYTFTFDLNHDGLATQKITQKVEEGKAAVRLASDPTRTGYVFDNWYTSTTYSVVYDFSTILAADATVYAKWTRSTTELTGTQTYTFEAEDVDLSGQVGNGLSGTAPETAMIVNADSSVGASNGRYVSYLYKVGLHLYFNFVSDVAVTGNIVIRFSEEVEAYTFNKDNYDIQLNNTAIDYPAVSFTASEVPAQTAAITVASFKDFTILSNATIKKGYNYLHLTTANSDAVSGTTMTAHAPIVDCVKITVDNAVLTWDGRSGLPAKNY